MPCRRRILATLVTLAAAVPWQRAQAQPPLAQERRFAAELQRALKAGDRAAVAGMIRYPARVAVARRRPIFVEDRQALLEMYDLVLTPQLRCAVIGSREPVDGAPPPRYPLVLAGGVVSIAGGRLIAERSQGAYLITRLASFGDTSTRGTPRPVTFLAGQEVGEFAGRVAEVGSDGYIVTARAGDRLQASITAFEAGSLSLRVSRRGGAKFLDGAEPGGAKWTGRLAESGDYVVEVVRRSPSCEPPVVSHVLTPSLNRRGTFR